MGLTRVISLYCVEIICDTIPCIKKESWIDELRKKDIFLSDVGSQQNSIDVLIGADVAGKLLTGKKYVPRNGLTAFETLLGCTVMEKLPEQRTGKLEAAAILTSFFIQEAGISDLWRLDVLGITDPIQNQDDLLKDENTRNFVRNTGKIIPEGRYEVRLPWKDDHAPLSENYDVAEQRLKISIGKLNKPNVSSAYNNVFESWLAENIIEAVLEAEISRKGRYLQHRPVIMLNSTTKIRPVFDVSASKRGSP
ncbi:uncharacterized protein LOC117169749 [Belonocnema kinseyi]|uniref:uncharacterized protein LOC117169749 n=1 Tax=Belonocnema kinseyi TaxID=2817044 RepID=UPI00143DAE40|nr:uncharacterized protein LOC117169749 [Belonocnema kinseyi]